MSRAKVDSPAVLLALIRHGWLTVPPLVHGLDSVIRQMIDNDYSSYKVRYDNLIREINNLRSKTYSDKELLRTKQGYYNCLLEARDKIKFWYTLTLNFYNGAETYGNFKRKLPECREIINLSKESTTVRAVKKKDTTDRKKRVT